MSVFVFDAPSWLWRDTAGVTIDPGAVPGEVIWQDQFDTAPAGQLDKPKGDAIFAPTFQPTGNDTFQHAAVVDDPPNGKYLRHTIPAGELGPTIVSPRLPVETDHAMLQYEWRFEAGFQPRYGGKMGPGLAGVVPGESIYAPTSGQANRDVGFSTRLMWHGRGGDGTNNENRPFVGSPPTYKLGPIPTGEDTDIVTYIYARQSPTMDPARFNNYGWSTHVGYFDVGVWYRIRMEVKLNTVGRQDGVFRAWVDDVLGFEATDCDYRMREDVRIQACLYDVHRGGGVDPDWTSTTTDYINIRNVVVTSL